MGGDRVVAQRIAQLSVDQAVKRCLQELFMHELENADLAVNRYTADYERAIERNAPAWMPEGEASEDTG